MTESIKPAPPSQPSRWRLRLLAVSIVGLLLMLALFLAWWVVVFVPGSSFEGQVADLDLHQQATRELLYRHIDHLAVTIGERNLDHYPALCTAANYVQQELEKVGYVVSRQTYQFNGLDCHNLEVEILGSTAPDEVVVVGAHYDSAPSTPGANDNASGTAALLTLARRFVKRKTDRTVRFVAFTNEEPPYFQTQAMGSWVYARRCHENDERLIAVISLETIGYFRDEPGSQLYPQPLGALYPDQGNFIAVVGNVASRPLVHQVVELFRENAQFPSEGGSIPGDVPGVGWSDHWSFWEFGYQGVMVTDTAPFRYPYYHHPDDTPDKLDFDSMARVVDGFEAVVAELASAT